TPGPRPRSRATPRTVWTSPRSPTGSPTARPACTRSWRTPRRSPRSCRRPSTSAGCAGSTARTSPRTTTGSTPCSADRRPRRVRASGRGPGELLDRDHRDPARPLVEVPAEGAHGQVLLSTGGALPQRVLEGRRDGADQVHVLPAQQDRLGVEHG